LTDGSVSNTNGVINLIKQNCESQNGKTKVFTFGIGSGAARDLVVRSAEAGHGAYYFV